MVIALSALKPSTHLSSKQHATSAPAMRYTRTESLTGALGVKSKLFGVRRRLVRLEAGVLYIHPDADEYAHPLAQLRVCEAQQVIVNPTRATIAIRTTSRIGVTLVFKHDVALLHAWAGALRRAHAARIDAYYKICAQIGAGHYAKVYEAFDRRTGEKVAIKMMSKHHADARVLQYAKREAEIVRTISHANIVKTLDVFETSTHLFIVMEFVEQNLLHFLAGGRNRVNEKNALRIARQLLSAIRYLHDNDILHRDIKAENVLVSPDGTIKLADFGLARRFSGVGADEYCLSSILGTPAYCSPEVVMRLQYGKPIDLFGCGVLLFLALSGALPFRGESPAQVFAAIAQGEVVFPEARWALVSREARDFVARLLALRAGERPTAAEALAHPWLVGGGGGGGHCARGGACGGQRTSDERPLSPTPFVRNASARVASVRSAAPRMPRVTSTASFRRVASGSLRQLTLEKMRQRAEQVA